MKEYHYKPIKNLIGQKFGRLTVKELNQEESDKLHKGIYICDCDCGNKNINVIANYLIGGVKQSCNCLRSQTTKERTNKHNYYEFHGNYVKGYTDCDHPSKASYDSQGRNYFYIDLEDYELIKDYYWKFNDQDYLISSSIHDSNYGKYPKLHRFILGLDKNNKEDVGHINGNSSRNDNRRSNLRVGSRTENNMNIGVRPNNTSGTTGVSFNKSYHKWETYISKNKMRIRLGYFDTLEEAIIARTKAENIYFGEWSYNNSKKIGVTT